MRRIPFILLFLVIHTAYAGIATIPWPKAVRDFPSGRSVRFETRAYVMTRSIPTDPAIRREGGSGGPVLDIKLRHKKSGHVFDLGGQSVGGRLLEDYADHPQIEIWGRGGGGSWSRRLHRFVSGRYRCVRIDEFTESAFRATNKSYTTTLPGGEDILCFVETRIPNDE